MSWIVNLYFWELTFLRNFQAFRSDTLDQVLCLLNLMDTTAYAVLATTAIWLLAGRQFAARWAVLVIVSSLVNVALKQALDLPRPCQIDPSLAVIPFSSPGFPSGAAQGALLFSTVLCEHYRRRGIYIFAATYTIIISLSRVGLGAHFFIDILGGWLVGGILFFAYYFAIRFLAISKSRCQSLFSASGSTVA